MHKIRYKIHVFWIKNIHVDGKVRPQYSRCMKILTADSMKQNKLKDISEQCMLKLLQKHLNFPTENWV